MISQTLPVSPIGTTVQFMRFCLKCQSAQIFIAGWQCQNGLLGCCLGCGDERIIPFTHTPSSELTF